MRNAKLQAQDLQRTSEFIQALLSKDDIRNEPLKIDTTNASAAPAQASQQQQQQQQKQQPPQPLHVVNGNGSVSFRADPKARFSDPPAPPPQQPLPEKPDVPSLKRGSSERPKSGSIGTAAGMIAMSPNAANSSSPIRPDVMGQVLQLNDALNTAKREIAAHLARVRELEEKLHNEQEARRHAEELTQQLELFSSVSKPTTKVDAAALASIVAPMMNGAAKGLGYGSGAAPGEGTNSTLEEKEASLLSMAKTDSESLKAEEAHAAAADDKINEKIDEKNDKNDKNDKIDKNDKNDDKSDESDESDEDRTDAAFRARIDSMMLEMEGMKRQLQVFQERAEKAEAERDADRETLAQMIQRIRQRDEEDAKKAAAEAAAAAAAAAAAMAETATAATTTTTTKGVLDPASISKSRKSSRSPSPNGKAFRAASSKAAGATTSGRDANSNGNGTASLKKTAAASRNSKEDESLLNGAGLARRDTITPELVARKVSHDAVVLHGIPYASMVGVVLLGMGLMAYINGWQPTPRLER